MSQRPLSTSAIDCASLLNDLCTQLNEIRYETRAALSQLALEDQIARYKIWAGNSGAFQRLPAISSLDYRVRESPKVATQIQELLEDLRHALQHIAAIASGERPNRVVESDAEEDDVVEDYDQVESEQAKDGGKGAAAYEMTIGQEEIYRLSEAEERFETVKDTITNLFRISVIIRNTSPHDRFAKALAARQEPFDDKFDIDHVGHKFPILNEKQWLKERLGKAITQRRQYLRYARDHKGKLGKEPQGLWEPDIGPNIDLPRHIDLEPSQAGRSSHTLPDSTLASTAASTPRLNDIATQEVDVKVTQSQTSNAVSLCADGDEPHLQLPSLADVSNKAPTFQCPLCWTVQNIREESAWHRHGFADLRPYVCTFEECDTKIFSHRREWFEHETIHHRARWRCEFCGLEDLFSMKSFQDHVQSRHVRGMTSEQLNALSEASKRFVDRMPAADCPFCNEWEAKLRQANPNISTDEIVVVTPSQFRHHVGAHMQQLALFSIPRACFKDDAETKSAANLANPRSNLAYGETRESGDVNSRESERKAGQVGWSNGGEYEQESEGEESEWENEWEIEDEEAEREGWAFWGSRREERNIEDEEAESETESEVESEAEIEAESEAGDYSAPHFNMSPPLTPPPLSPASST